jgi:serine/threonine protein kinase
VIEGLSASLSPGLQQELAGTSAFAGSMRWMAPELVAHMVDDDSDGKVPQVTTFSDVYAFAAVCLEVSRTFSHFHSNLLFFYVFLRSSRIFSLHEHSTFQFNSHALLFR